MRAAPRYVCVTQDTAQEHRARLTVTSDVIGAENLVKPRRLLEAAGGAWGGGQEERRLRERTRDCLPSSCCNKAAHSGPSVCRRVRTSACFASSALPRAADSAGARQGVLCTEPGCSGLGARHRCRRRVHLPSGTSSSLRFLLKDCTLTDPHVPPTNTSCSISHSRCSPIARRPY